VVEILTIGAIQVRFLSFPLCCVFILSLRLYDRVFLYERWNSVCDNSVFLEMISLHDNTLKNSLSLSLDQLLLDQLLLNYRGSMEVKYTVKYVTVTSL